MTFVRNHAKAVIASDFFIVVTATFQLVYVFVIMEIETRRILHFNVTNIRLPNGRFNSSESASPAMKGISFSSTIATVFIPKSWMHP